jgi:hypothetical protein
MEETPSIFKFKHHGPFTAICPKQKKGQKPKLKRNYSVKHYNPNCNMKQRMHGSREIEIEILIIIDKSKVKIKMCLSK